MIMTIDMLMDGNFYALVIQFLISIAKNRIFSWPIVSFNSIFCVPFLVADY